MTALEQSIAGLCAAIDAGDDSVLPILADALEDAGDPRADGLRLVGDRQPERNTWIANIDADAPLQEGSPLWLWRRTRPLRARAGHPERLAPRLFERLPHPASNYVAQLGRDHVRPYPTRSAAYLALGAALLDS
jgi:hypothetical protein